MSVNETYNNKYNDTPITRTSIADMPIEQLQAFTAELQERRLRAFSIYQAAKEAKEEKAHGSQAEQLSKKLDTFVKKAEAAEKALQVLEKLAVDILSLRLALGHEINFKQ